jgi:hypothetical protein
MVIVSTSSGEAVFVAVFCDVGVFSVVVVADGRITTGVLVVVVFELPVLLPLLETASAPNPTQRVMQQQRRINSATIIMITIDVLFFFKVSSIGKF